jgi:hypothetical protein
VAFNPFHDQLLLSGGSDGRAGASSGEQRRRDNGRLVIDVRDGSRPSHTSPCLPSVCARVRTPFAALWRISSISSAPLLELGDEDIDPDTGAWGGAARGAMRLAADAPASESVWGAGSIVCYLRRHVCSTSPLSHLPHPPAHLAPTPAGRKVEPKQAPDAAIRTHDDDHDDSVVAAAWSPHNAWVYASLSYGGRLVVAQVPSAEKYRVLL